MLIPVIDLAIRISTGRDMRTAILLRFRVGAAGAPFSYPAEITIHPPPRERVGESVAGY